MDFISKLRIKPGNKVDLQKHDPDFTGDHKKEEADKLLAKNLKDMAALQNLLYAENKRSLLIILQAIDAGGKDGTIRHVMSGVNPQSCRVTSFKVPTELELAHDFLWRIHQAVPRKGEIVIFNRSHYEDVLVVRVHEMVPKTVWSQRCDGINAFENSLAASGTIVLKFFLHISKQEQLERLKARIDDPQKQWKLSPQDFAERKLWPDYMHAYQDAISKCSTEAAPWFVIPAN
ncbi:MAG: polyphosphate kinase 2 family protein, partial [Planctomycetaceae bacterium]